MTRERRRVRGGEGTSGWQSKHPLRLSMGWDSIVQDMVQDMVQDVGGPHLVNRARARSAGPQRV